MFRGARVRACCLRAPGHREATQWLQPCVHSASRCCTEGEGRGADSKTTYAEPDGGAAGREVDITFGQGTVNGRLTREAVRVGALTAANQSVSSYLMLGEAYMKVRRGQARRWPPLGEGTPRPGQEMAAPW